MLALVPAVCGFARTLFSLVADDSSVAVWKVSLACAALLGVDTLLLILLLWRVRTLRAALLPVVAAAAALGCLVLAYVAWMRSRTFIQVICATGLHVTSPTDPIILRAEAAAQTTWSSRTSQPWPSWWR